jgi:hypothetical protein
MLIALAVLALQDQDPGPIVLPPGSSREFQGMVYAVQTAVAEGDWDEARRLAARLPSYEVSFQWDDASVPSQKKLFFTQAREEGLQVWRQGLPEVKFAEARDAKVKFAFVQSLPPNADSPGPAGAVFLVSPLDGEPVVEAVLALVRGVDKRLTDVREVRNEVAYAVGTYFGLARQVKPPDLMYRTEESYIVDNAFTMGDARLARKNVEIADRIRKDVAARRDPGIATPHIVIDPAKFEPKPVSQGGEMLLTLQVTNQGRGTLDYRLVPDCGCFMVGSYKERLAPGETNVIQVLINTMDFTGRLNKALFVYSNDPYFPIKRIPLETVVRPAYRFVDQQKEPNVIVDENGGKFETILVLDEGQDFKIKRASVNGVSARVSVDDEMWHGMLDYPEIGEGPKMRKGYAISALIAPGVPPGRLSLQIQLETDDDVFKTIVHHVYVQRGIVSVPLSLYFGTIPQEPARATVLLTRPGQPYKVLKVESDLGFITASVEPYRAETEYKVVATFTGKAPIGRFSGKIKVYTDDPKQPVVEVPVEGTVR